MTPTQHRHVRIDDATWAKAKKRAAREGTTPSAVIREFVVAYAGGYPFGRFPLPNDNAR